LKEERWAAYAASLREVDRVALMMYVGTTPRGKKGIETVLGPVVDAVAVIAMLGSEYVLDAGSDLRDELADCMQHPKDRGAFDEARNRWTTAVRKALQVGDPAPQPSRSRVNKV
jgi:hypothetical protein